MLRAIERVTVAIGALSVAACGGQSASIPGSTAGEPAGATQAVESRPVSLQNGGVPAQAQETVLHSFGRATDAADPQAGLINVNGVLYGTSPYGGAIGVGTVFAITTSGAETVLHTFVAGSDGAYPFAGLTEVNGVLYGTTAHGGTSGNGTVFAITTSGAESVLYSFAGGSDGANPYAGLTDANGVLYGTTEEGGTNDNNGTVFSITTSGAESVLYRFAGGSDGEQPYAPMINVNGVLYGTTTQGGGSGCLGEGCGTVFAITPSGAESVLHTFAGSDGAEPYAGLTADSGVLYGTTEEGGASNNGTVFKITTSGTETVLHSFGAGNDGSSPLAGLTNVNGVLYGTTFAGGGSGDGTVFKITTSGVKSVLFSFAGSNGRQPHAALTDVNDMLYGTTFYGGANREGTVFSLSL